jgi:hypothetical protein
MPSEDIKKLLQQTADQAAGIDASQSLEAVQRRVHQGTALLAKVGTDHVKPIIDQIQAIPGYHGTLARLLICETLLEALGRDDRLNVMFSASCLTQAGNVKNFTVDAIVDFAEAELAQQEDPA